MIEVSQTRTPIHFAPATLEEEVAQNVRMILSTVQGELPLDRAFGLASGAIDEPMAIAQARLTSLIIAAVQAYEPRATVVQVSFEGDEANHLLQPTVQITIGEEDAG